MKIYKKLSLAGGLILLLSACQTTKKSQYDDAPEVTLPPITVESQKVYKGSAQKDFLIRHTELHLTPDWKTRTLNGMARLMLQVGAYPQDTLVLDARGMTIIGNVYIGDLLHSPGDDMPEADAPQNYRYDGKKMYIGLQRRAEPGEKFIIGIVYIAKPEEQLAKGLIDDNSSQGLFFINPDRSDSIIPRQMWSQGEVKDNSAWFPTIDEPNQKMTQDIYLTVDTGLVTLSNGELVYSNLNKDGTRTDYWQMEKPHAPYLAMIAAGEWTVTHDEWRDSIPVEYYLEKRYAPYARTIFGTTPEMIEFFSRKMGYDYPWPKFSQVVARQFVTGAMENTSAVVHYDPVQHDKRQHLDNSQEEIIAHELFHHWFGDLVTCESWSQIALNESMATLGESLWLEYKHGKDEADKHLKDNLDEYLDETAYTVDAIINHYYADPDNLFDAHRYQKGGLVFNMLRNYLGDTVFFTGLKNYLHQNEFKTVELSDMRKAMEEASGQDLEWFFTQWFEKPGHPVLNIEHEYQPADKRYRLVVNQEQSMPDVPVFRIPVRVDIYKNKTTKTSQIIWLKNWTDTFYFKVDAEPELVNFDADKVVLCSKTENKSPREWYAQFLYGSGRDKDEALDAISEKLSGISADSLNRLIRMGLADPFWYTRKRTIETVLYNLQKEDDKGADTYGVGLLAKSDPDSKVRASALTDLAHFDLGLQPFYSALHDSSYLVVSTAIRSLLQKAEKDDSLKILEALKPLENIHGSDVLLGMGEAYARYAPANKISFFHTAYPWISTQSLARYVDYYSRYVATQPFTILKQEEGFILGMGDNIHDLWGTVMYRNMLLSYIKALEKVSDADSGLTKSEREALAKKFKDKVDVMTVKSDK